MVANNSLNLINLDFDTQKADLKSFLQSQAIFKDYDFEGSNINVLLDLLSHNTLKNIFYLNMAISEGFIDSAQLRNTVFSHAKELNYLPRSAKSAKATITVNFEANGNSQPYIIQKGQSFSSLIKDRSLVFSVPETITCASVNTSFSFTTDIYEGIYVKDSFIYNDTSITHPTFKISNPNVDLSSIVVTVYEDQNVIGDTYTYTTSLLGLNENSKVFFIQTNVSDGKYEVLFGDNVAGRAPKNNAVVILDYRISSGKLGNGASTFSINFDPTGLTSELTGPVGVVVSQNGIGGAEQEDIESVRFYAPRYFQVQERAVTASDYNVLLKTRFPEIHAINVYGGEELTPPQFGKVIIALQISNIVGLPISKIAQYRQFLKERTPLTIQTIFTLPQFTFIQLDSKVRYNINITNESTNRLKTIVTAAITDFNEQNLNDFNTTLRFSQLTTTIDESDPSIISNVTDLLLYKKLAPSTSTPQNYILNFAQSLKHRFPPTATSHKLNEKKVLSSDTFQYKGVAAQLEDDGNGNVRAVEVSGSTLTTIAVVGTINYDSGIINLVDFQPDGYNGTSINIFVQPIDNDVSCKQNTILLIEPAGINLTIEQLAL